MMRWIRFQPYCLLSMWRWWPHWSFSDCLNEVGKFGLLCLITNVSCQWMCLYLVPLDHFVYEKGLHLDPSHMRRNMHFFFSFCLGKQNAYEIASLIDCQHDLMMSTRPLYFISVIHRVILEKGQNNIKRKLCWFIWV